MNTWFELVKEKNQLLRYENKLMIEQRELQLQVRIYEENSASSSSSSSLILSENSEEQLFKTHIPFCQTFWVWNCIHVLSVFHVSPLVTTTCFESTIEEILFSLRFIVSDIFGINVLGLVFVKQLFSTNELIWWKTVVFGVLLITFLNFWKLWTQYIWWLVIMPSVFKIGAKSV